MRPQRKEQAKRKQTVENLDFIPWLKQKRGLATAIFASLPLAISLVLPILKWLGASFLPLPENHSFWLSLIQLVFIIACFIYFYKPPITFGSHAGKAELIANEVSSQFWRAWRLLWAGWLLLYLALVMKSLHGIGARITLEALITRAATHILNNLSSVALILCYAVLARITVNQNEEAQESTQKRKHRPRLEKAEELLAFLWLAFAVIEILVVIFPVDINLRKIWLDWLGLFSGCIGAMSMALLIGRLDSMLLGVPALIIAALFLYSSIQPGFDEFVVKVPSEYANESVVRVPSEIKELKEVNTLEVMRATQKASQEEDVDQLKKFIGTVLLLYALIGKVLFFIVIEWLDSSGRLLFYMAKARQQLKSIPSERYKYVKEKLE